MAPSQPNVAPRGKCAICGRAADAHYRPFCSRRCADVDLSRWLRGVYAIPSDTADAHPSDAAYAPDAEAPGGNGGTGQTS